jgi:uncharacterized protein
MGCDADISLAAVLPPEQALGEPGQSVRKLAREFSIRRVRMKPLLPLGRAAEYENAGAPESVSFHTRPEEIISWGFSPIHTCGIGENLYVEPDGGSYPCYSWCGEDWNLGNIARDGLDSIISSDAFKNLSRHNVNTNYKCKRCGLRYLCGGACRAWNGTLHQEDLDEGPRDCENHFSHARSLLSGALEFLEIPERYWTDSGLMIPDRPPENI